MNANLVDLFGRRFTYLRLSLTDVCNFRCEYCLPDGYRGGRRDFLGRDEVLRLVRAFAELGIVKVRLTGGEPLVRRDIGDIVGDLAGVPGIERLVMTTNAYRLAPIVDALRDAGLHGVNISLDSLDRAAFERITGSDRHGDVMAGVDAAVEAGLSVKINAILLGGQNDAEIPDFIEFVRERPVSVRFIELMQTRDNRAYFATRHRRAALVTDRLRAEGWTALQRADTAGPAREFGHPDYRGRVGVIEPYAAHFCDGCNRLRVTALGGLRLCLFGTGTHDLRPLLGSDGDRDALKAAIVDALSHKGSSHDLIRGSCGDTPHLAMTGG